MNKWNKNPRRTENDGHDEWLDGCVEEAKEEDDVRSKKKRYLFDI